MVEKVFDSNGNNVKKMRQKCLSVWSTKDTDGGLFIIIMKMLEENSILEALECQVENSGL